MPQRTQAITWHRFRLFPFRSPLHRESLCFLFLALLRCFSSCRSPSCPIYSDKSIIGLLWWVSPFGNLRITAWLTAPRSLWQPSASFVVSWCQGIHRKPLKINHKLTYADIEILTKICFTRTSLHYRYFKEHNFLHRVINYTVFGTWNVVEMIGFEPMTFRLQSGRSANWATPPLITRKSRPNHWWA